MNMTVEERINALARLGETLREEDEYRAAVMHRTQFNNPWFSVENQEKAIDVAARQFLDAEKLRSWLEKYGPPELPISRTVGIVPSGNVPLSGFHDWLSAFLAGHRVQFKLPEKDQYLFPYLVKMLSKIDKRTSAYTQFKERLSGFDAIIAASRGGSQRYFQTYFRRYPHLLRPARRGVAVLSGEETREELLALGEDVFTYYGLGDRSVAKVFVPEGYDFDPLLEALHEYRDVVLNNNYKNHFDYNYALYLLNKADFKANGCIILLKDASLHSRIACLHYELYKKTEEVEDKLRRAGSEITCVVEEKARLRRKTLAFGRSQAPELWDQEESKDPLAFLLQLAAQSADG